MATSFKKSLKAGRRTHKERAQPENRKRFGLLEKASDWKVRREHFHAREKRMKILAEKARNRNPDEFYFDMLGSRTKDGVHIKPQASIKYTADELKLMATQDSAYLTHRRSQELKKIEKLQEGLHFLGQKAKVAKNTHTVFVDDEEDVEKFDPAEFFDTAPELLPRKFNRPRLSALEAHPLPTPSSKEMEVLAKARAAEYDELSQRIQRAGKLASVGNSMQLRRDLMKKGPRRKISKEGQKPVYKWAKKRAK